MMASAPTVEPIPTTAPARTVAPFRTVAPIWMMAPGSTMALEETLAPIPMCAGAPGPRGFGRLSPSTAAPATPRATPSVRNAPSPVPTRTRKQPADSATSTPPNRPVGEAREGAGTPSVPSAVARARAASSRTRLRSSVISGTFTSAKCSSRGARQVTVLDQSYGGREGHPWPVLRAGLEASRVRGCDLDVGNARAFSPSPSSVKTVTKSQLALLLTFGFSLLGVVGDYFLKVASLSEKPFRSAAFYIGFAVYGSTAFGWLFAMRNF